MRIYITIRTSRKPAVYKKIIGKNIEKHKLKIFKNLNNIRYLKN